MRVIEFIIPCESLVTVKMPEGAEVVSFGRKTEGFCIWALADVRRRKIPRTFIVSGTGMEFSASHHHYIGTAQSGDMSWHLLEVFRSWSTLTKRGEVEIDG